jgi:hypothetical protein
VCACVCVCVWGGGDRRSHAQPLLWPAAALHLLTTAVLLLVAVASRLRIASRTQRARMQKEHAHLLAVLGLLPVRDLAYRQ